MMEALLARRIRDARAARGWTLEAAAAASGVSRAMISRIERGEASPTAATLARLAAGFGLSLAALFEDADAPATPLSRAAERPAWTDPATGYVRRNVSPAAAGEGARIVEVDLPAGARVAFDNAPAAPGLAQQVWLLAGALRVSVGPAAHLLAPGDCLHMRLDAPVALENPGPDTARYALVLARAFF